jgi:fructokinase
MIICCGEALLDMIRTQIPGSGEAFLPLPGGSPYNTAIAIGRLGIPVKFIGRLSTDFFGETLVKRLRDNRVGDELLIRSKQNTALAFVKLEKNKDPQYVFYTEGTAGLSLTTEELPAKLPADTRCIHFGSIAMTMEPIASAIEALILREATRKSIDQMDGAPILSFDPNIRTFMISDRADYIQRFERWIAASTIAKISVSDFEFLYPKLEAEKALQKILAMGPRLAICTLGTKGALALLRRNDGSVTRISAPVVALPVVDTIGAGDAFQGALLAWLERKGKMSRSALVNLSENELYDALLFANKAASIVCSRRGAEPPTKREIDNLKMPAGKSAAKPVAAAKSAVPTKKATPAKKVASAKETAAKKVTTQKDATKKAAEPAGKENKGNLQ